MTRLRSTVVALTLTLALLGASGCGSTTELAAERGRTLQASVLEVTRAAAQGDWDEASTLLASTRELLDAGVEQGEVSAMRYRAIDAALDDVEAELAAAQRRAAAAKAAAEAEATAPADEETPAQRTATTSVENTKAPSKPEPARPAPPSEPKKPKKPKKPAKVEAPDTTRGDKGKKEPRVRKRG